MFSPLWIFYSTLGFVSQSKRLSLFPFSFLGVTWTLNLSLSFYARLSQSWPLIYDYRIKTYTRSDIVYVHVVIIIFRYIDFYSLTLEGFYDFGVITIKCTFDCEYMHSFSINFFFHFESHVFMFISSFYFGERIIREALLKRFTISLQAKILGQVHVNMVINISESLFHNERYRCEQLY